MATILEQLMAEIQQAQSNTRYKHDTPTGTPSTPYMHGPGGLFGTAGLERDIISTRVLPKGLGSMLPTKGVTVTNPLFPYITGFLDVSGDVADGVCDDPQTAGPIKNCYQTAQFGRYSFMTREMELNAIGLQTNRGEFLDLRILNDPLLAGTNNILTPNVPGNPSLTREVLVRFMEVGVAFQNQLMRQVYIGNPASNSAGGGYKEFPGLDILIGVNKVDALTGVACPSLRSDIKDFNYQNVNVNSGQTIMNVFSYLLRTVRWIANRTNMDPVRWVVAMRPTLFWEIADVWACAYQTYRCASGDTQAVYDASDTIRMRDDMRRNSYLLLDGERIEVIQDDGILEEDTGDNANIPNTCFASDIYLIPVTVRGGLASTYWEYVNYSETAMQGVADGGLQGDFWTDGGRFLWHKKPPVNWCVQWLSKIEPRIILHTPHLAGRITNVLYCPLQHTRDAHPDDAYFVDGGVTSRSSSTLYSDWNLHATR